MKVFYGFDNLANFRNPAVTIGSFDGMHRGHTVLLSRVIEQAKAAQGESVVLTFEPHPRLVLNANYSINLLTTLKEKIYLLEQLGIDNLIVIPFNIAVSKISSTDFIQNYLISAIGIKSLIVGYNNHFGRDKEGGHNFLRDNDFGFKVIEIEEINIADTPNLSSTVIRELVIAGDMTQVALMLSHPYVVCGKNIAGVVYIDNTQKLLPPRGEYDVVIDGKSQTLTISEDNILKIDKNSPQGDIIINF